MTASDRYPMSAVVGQDDAKLALQLAALDPAIGGVLLRGHKGSAKTTLARGLAGLLADAPFVELPLGATEDRLIGTLDLPSALGAGEVRFHPGLLARAHGGVLYVDEVNLLADHLVDVLLDVAVSGTNVVEREGVSHRHPARFVLVGSMNPEEGELRPQLLDRFGLCVGVTDLRDAADRAELARRLAVATPAAVPDELTEAAARLALAVGAEGLRADITLCRAAAAHAGLVGRGAADESDLRRIAPLVLSHRARRAPFDPPTLEPDVLERAVQDALDDPDERGPDDSGADDSGADPSGADPERGAPLGEERRLGSIERPSVESSRGRLLRDVPADGAPNTPVAVMGTVREVARRRATDPSHQWDAGDLRVAVREERSTRLLVLTVDLSGSMGAVARAEAATGSALGLLVDAYQRRDQVALIGFRGPGAEILLAPTTSVEVARNRLGSLKTGGETPLGEGIRAALRLTTQRDGTRVPLIVLLTDGRATGRPDAVDDALAAAATVRRAGVSGLVLDCETTGPRLGLTARIADAMGARLVRVPAVDANAICSIIRTTSGAH